MAEKKRFWKVEKVHLGKDVLFDKNLTERLMEVAKVEISNEGAHTIFPKENPLYISVNASFVSSFVVVRYYFRCGKEEIPGHHPNFGESDISIEYVKDFSYYQNYLGSYLETKLKKLESKRIGLKYKIKRDLKRLVDKL